MSNLLNDADGSDETPVERIGSLVIQLLEAARGHGDAGLILAAEVAALEAGRVIAMYLTQSNTPELP